MHCTGTKSATKVRRLQNVGASIAVIGAILLSASLAVGQDSRKEPGTVIFVCKYGSMKSQMAAAYFNRLAKERGLHLSATSRALQPDPEIPAHIRAAMAADGLAPVSEPIKLKPEEASAATKVISFDDVPAEVRGTASVTLWSDVPPSKKDYRAAMNVIMRHVREEIEADENTGLSSR